MPLGTTRDVLLVIRAKDQASRTLNEMSRTWAKLDQRVHQANQTYREYELRVRKARDAQREAHYKAMQDHQAEIRKLRDKMATRLEEVKLSAMSDERKRLASMKVRAGILAEIKAIEALKIAEKDEHRARMSQLTARLSAAKAVRDTELAHISGITGAMANRQARGSSMVAAGASIAAVGAVTLGFYASATNAAIKYNKQVALTSTQLGILGSKQKELHDFGLQLASSIAVPLEDIQPAIFDIFSSFDVNFEQGKKLATEFARAAVAGDVTMQEAGRATIEVLNGMGLGVKDISHVLDIQFQMVRRGVGTYKEFAGALGLAIPQAHAAKQSFESVAGSVAFMTRVFGGKARNAAVSFTRFLELLAKPDAAKELHKVGVEVYDANGKFRPMLEIVSQLNAKFGKMNDAQKAIEFKKIFGTSTVQARRFFQAVTENFPLYKSIVESMQQSAGSLNKAYDVTSKQAANKIQVLKNNWKQLKVQAGDALIPVVNKLVEGLTKLLRWFNNLSPSTRKWIIYISAALAVLTVFIGVLTAAAGAFLILTSAAAALGTGLGALSLAFMGPVAAAGALVYVGYKLFDQWRDNINAQHEYSKTLAAAEDRLRTAREHQQLLAQTLGVSKDRLRELAHAAGVSMTESLDVIIPKILALKPALLEGISNPAIAATRALMTLSINLELVGQNMVDFLGGVGPISDIIKGVSSGTALTAQGKSGSDALLGLTAGTLGPGGMSLPDYDKAKRAAKGVVDQMQKNRKAAEDAAKKVAGYGGYPADKKKKGSGSGSARDVTSRAVLAAQTAFSKEMAPVARLWAGFAKIPAQEITAGTGPVSKAANLLADSIEAAWKKKIGTLKGKMPQDVADLVKAMRTRAEEAQKFREDVFKAAMGGGIMDTASKAKETYGEVTSSTIKMSLQQKLKDTRAFASNLKKLAQAGLDPQFIREIALAGVDAGGEVAAALASGPASDIKAINQLSSQIRAAARGVATTAELALYGPGQAAVQSLINGIKSKFPAVKAVLQELTRLMATWKGPASVDRKLLVPNGQMIMGSLVDGLHSGYGDVRHALRDMTMDIGRQVSPVGGGSTRAAETSGKTITVKQTIYTQEINPTKHAADLGWEVARRL